VAFLAGVILAILRHMLLFIVVFVGLGVITDLLFWKFARYELVYPVMAKSNEAADERIS